MKYLTLMCALKGNTDINVNFFSSDGELHRKHPQGKENLDNY